MTARRTLQRPSGWTAKAGVLCLETWPMSHFTKVHAKIQNLTCLKGALKDLGYEFEEAREGRNVAVRGYKGQTTEAAISIRASKTFDIGVVVTDRGVEFVSDWWGVESTRGVTQEDFVNQVTQRCAYDQVKTEVEKRGYRLDAEEVDPHGGIELKVSRR